MVEMAARFIGIQHDASFAKAAADESEVIHEAALNCANDLEPKLKAVEKEIEKPG